MAAIVHKMTLILLSGLLRQVIVGFVFILRWSLLTYVHGF